MDTMATLNDNELIQAYCDGDHSAFEELLARYQVKVYGYIFSVVKEKEAADDIFQDTWLKVIVTLNSGIYRDENKFGHWVMRIAHNLIVDYYRRAGKMPLVANKEGYEVVENLNLQPGENAEQGMIRQQTAIAIRRLVKMLPPEQRRVVILRHFGHCDFKDIAARTGVSINTALGRMRYAIINLRRLAQENNMHIEL